jgi:hypothetical protein
MGRLDPSMLTASEGPQQPSAQQRKYATDRVLKYGDYY